MTKESADRFAQEPEAFKLGFNMRLLSLLILKYPLRHFYEDWMLHVDGFINKNGQDGKRMRKGEIKKVVGQWADIVIGSLENIN